MKTLLVALLLFCIFTLHNSSQTKKDDLKASLKSKIVQLLPKKLLDHQWKNFKSRYNKSYSDLKEESRRLEIYAEKLSLIHAHNKNNKDFKLEVNEYADLTSQEFGLKRTGWRRRKEMFPFSRTDNKTKLGVKIFTTNTNNVSAKPLTLEKSSPKSSLPESMDWRKEGVISVAKDQGSCGSCWAFAVAGAVSAFYSKETQTPPVDLSPQQLLDCVKGGYFISSGCDGGAVEDAFDYVRENGIVTEDKYPYTFKSSGACRIPWFVQQRLKIWDYYSVRTLRLPSSSNNLLLKRNQDILNLKLMTALQEGPVTAAIDATSYFFQFYKNGILSDIVCSDTDPNHAVLVVGYDQDSWIIKNSWGEEWGEKGFFRLDKKTPCGLTISMHQPIL
jgi:cathepsin H